MSDSTQRNNPPRDEYDSPWKIVIENFFDSFIGFFFPQAYNDIDWEKPFEFLDKELQQIDLESKDRRRFVDKLAKVWLKDGKETWLLVHIEVQTTYEADFAKRMFIYNYRLFERHDKEIVSMAVLADENPKWRPQSYVYGRWGSKMELEFAIVKLLDYSNRWKQLVESENPFAVVVMAHLRTQRTRGDAKDRLRQKIEIVRTLYKRGYQRTTVIELFRFIDWVMALPKDLDKAFKIELREFEEASKMQYVTSIERLAKEEGREEGAVSQARKGLLKILEGRFEDVSVPILEQIEQIDDIDILNELLVTSATIDSIEAFETVIPEPGESEKDAEYTPDKNAEDEIDEPLPNQK